MKKTLAIILAAVMVFALAACGNSGGGTTPEPTPAGSGSSSAAPAPAAPASKDSLAVCIASEPQTIDPALNSAVDGATMLVHLFSGLAKWEKDGEGFKIVPDMAEALVDPVDNGDGTYTYTYTIRDAKWSDGEPVKAQDFEFAWKRATSTELAADYAYMFEYIVGYNADLYPLAENKLSVTATDDKTLVVTTTGNYPFWNELLAFPTYFPVREDVVDNDGAWATKPETYVTNGLYTLDSWEHNSVITIKKNENHPDAALVTMPEIKFYLSDDANNMLSNFKNGDWLLVDDVPTNEISSLKTDYPTEFHVDGQIGTYYVCWNINEDISPVGGEALTEEQKAEVRSAIGLLFDRNYIVNDVAQGGQVPASSFVAMGITEPDGGQFYEHAGHSTDYVGYYPISEDSLQANYDAAMEVLSKYYDVQDGKVTNFPTMTYLYNTSEGHKAIAEYLQSALAGVGITMNLENQEWATFLDTRKAGNFTIARNGWVADFNDAISFIDMWTTASGNNDVQFGREGHGEQAIYNMDLSAIEGYADKSVTGGTWADTFDVLVSMIKTESNLEVRNQLMHVAEDLIMQTGCICPLYFYTDLYMLSDSVDGFYSIPLGYKYFMYTTIN
jgi:oligopeptide transport system substrate-binding protein